MSTTERGHLLKGEYTTTHLLFQSPERKKASLIVDYLLSCTPDFWDTGRFTVEQDGQDQRDKCLVGRAMDGCIPE